MESKFTRRTSNNTKRELILCIDMGISYAKVALVDPMFTRAAAGEWSRDLTWFKSMSTAVAFVDDGPPLVGDEALAQAAGNPLNTIFQLRKYLGRKFDDPEVTNAAKFQSYHVKMGPNN